MDHLFDAPTLEDLSWVNGPETSVGEGLVLLDFWNVGCRSCVKALENMNDIHELEGLKVVGVHTAERDIGSNIEKVESAVRRYGVNYPVAVDTDNTVKKAYGMSYWPSIVLLKEGETVWRGFSKSGVEGLKQKLSEILDIDLELEFRGGHTEYGCGFLEADGVNNDSCFNGVKELEMPENRSFGQLYLGGRWRQDKHFVEAMGPGSELRFKMEPGETGIVVDPDGNIRDVEVLVDGNPVSEDDILEDLKNGLRVKHPGHYDIVSKDDPFELILRPDKRTKIYSITRD